MCGMVAFCGAHIQSYYKGCLTFGFFDVTEIQFLGISLYIMCAVGDANFWNTQIYGMPIKFVPAWFTIATCSQVIAGNVYVTLTCKHVPYASTKLAEMWLGPIIEFSLATAWFGQTRHLWQGYDLVFFMCAIGTLNAAHACSLIVAHMAHAAVGRLVLLRFVPLALCATASIMEVVPARQAIYVCLVFNLVMFLHYSISVCYEISTFLGIRIFKVGAPTAKDMRKN